MAESNEKSEKRKYHGSATRWLERWREKIGSEVGVCEEIDVGTRGF